MSLVGILYNVFGDVKNDDKLQVQVNCKNCSDLYNYGEPDNKYNLEINLQKQVCKCWKCGYTSRLGSAIRVYGSYSDNKLFKDYAFIYDDSGIEKQIRRVHIPKQFISFKDGYKDYDFEHKQALNYLLSRGITWNQIVKYNIGFCLNGYYGGRIIFPSRNEEGDYDFFTARTFIGDKIPYIMPKYPKELVIFNEFHIDWGKPVCLVEGIVDALAIGNNAIPVLGKGIPHKKLYDKLVENNCITIVIYDKGEIWDMYRAMELLYNLGLDDRIYYTELKSHKDLGMVKEVEGITGIKKVIKSVKKFNPDDFQDIVYDMMLKKEEEYKKRKKKFLKI